MGGLGVRVNAVAPGVTDTRPGALTDDLRGAIIGQTPLGRLGQPEEIARAVLFLSSGAGGWITGQNVAASGGFML